MCGKIEGVSEVGWLVCHRVSLVLLEISFDTLMEEERGDSKTRPVTLASDGTLARLCTCIFRWEERFPLSVLTTLSDPLTSSQRSWDLFLDASRPYDISDWTLRC